MFYSLFDTTIQLAWQLTCGPNKFKVGVQVWTVETRLKLSEQRTGFSKLEITMGFGTFFHGQSNNRIITE